MSCYSGVSGDDRVSLVGLCHVTLGCQFLRWDYVMLLWDVSFSGGATSCLIYSGMSGHK